MKKQLLTLSLLLIILAGCGSDVTEIDRGSETDKKEVPKVEEPEKETEVVTEPVDENVQEDDSLKATNTYTNKELGISGTTGSFNYAITGVQLKKIEPKTQESADLFEVKIGEVVNVVTIEMSGENTSEEDMTFYLGQAVAITDTKEQLDPDMFLSEHIEGEYLGKVKHEGYNVYVLKNSSVDDLSTIEIRISAPTNSNYDSVGEDLKHIIEVNK